MVEKTTQEHKDYHDKWISHQVFYMPPSWSQSKILGEGWRLGRGTISVTVEYTTSSKQGLWDSLCSLLKWL